MPKCRCGREMGEKNRYCQLKCYEDATGDMSAHPEKKSKEKVQGDTEETPPEVPEDEY